MNAPPDWLLFLGRFHPVLVHLPIGFIVALAALELLARSARFTNATANAGHILALAVPAALMAAACGWLLSLAGGYDEALVQWHKWTGIGTTAACVLAALAWWLKLKRAYRCLLAATIAVLLVASHFGGSLTHGSDYLFRYAPAPLRAWLSEGDSSTAPAGEPERPSQFAVFADVIRPVLEEHCFACHGPEKSKGGLRVDSVESLLTGGHSGPAIVPHQSSDSLLLQRVRLPLAHEDHMPPEGKPQLAADDIALITWWADAGAPSHKTMEALRPPPEIQRILTGRMAPPAAAEAERAPKPRQEILLEAAHLASELGIIVGPLSEQDPWLQANASVVGPAFGDADLAKLGPLADNLRWLDLAGTGVTDAGLAVLASLRNLTRLHLERTAITDAGLTHLANLTELEYLNLYGTTVSDAGLDTLRGLPQLRQIYLWQTQVTPDAAKAFTESRVDQAQIDRWRQEIEALKAKIESHRLVLSLGTAAAPEATSHAVPVNAQCPVSGKPVDATKTVQHEGRLIAFCCDDCKAKFQADPTPFLTKLGLAKESE